MTTEQDRILARLREHWGGRWEVWVVNRVVGGPVWCARLHDNHAKVLNAYEPQHLEEYMAEVEADL